MPRLLYPPVKKNWYPLYRKLGGPLGRSGRVQETSPPLGFNPQTVQPVVSHSTEYALGYTYIWKTVYAMKFFFTNTPRNYYNRCRTGICYLFLNLLFIQEKLLTFIRDVSCPGVYEPSAKKRMNCSNATTSRMTTYRIILKSSRDLQLSPTVCNSDNQFYKYCTTLVKFLSLSLHFLNYHR
jgi:hypothetical protein